MSAVDRTGSLTPTEEPEEAWPDDLSKAFGLVAMHADEMEWTPLKDTPGFMIDIPGVTTKYFGEGEKGPWFYLVKHEPGTIVARHGHNGNVIHYILSGTWKLGHHEKGAGWFHYEQKGLRYGPLISGDQGSLFLAIYDARPDFITD